jgi:hypothetical protein
LLRDGRIKRRRQKGIKFDAARKLSQCAINGVSCGGVGCKRDEPNTFCSIGIKIYQGAKIYLCKPWDL